MQATQKGFSLEMYFSSRRDTMETKTSYSHTSYLVSLIILILKRKETQRNINEI